MYIRSTEDGPHPFAGWQVGNLPPLLWAIMYDYDKELFIYISYTYINNIYDMSICDYTSIIHTHYH